MSILKLLQQNIRQAVGKLVLDNTLKEKPPNFIRKISSKTTLNSKTRLGVLDLLLALKGAVCVV